MGSDQEFRERVLVILTDVQTKMNSLVGVDGTEGRVADLDKRIQLIETAQSRVRGAAALLVFLWGAVEMALRHFRK